MPPVEAAPQGQRQNPLVAVILVAVIVVALGFFIKNLIPKKTPRPDVFWLCEDCGVEFTGKTGIGPIDCVACAGQEAVRLIKYECLVHDHIFDAYLTKPEPESYARYLEKMAEMEAERAATEGEGAPRQGTNSWGRVGYGGPCPPSGTHRYFFKLYALDEVLDLPDSTDKSGLLDAMEGHVLLSGDLLGLYARP